MAPAIAKSLSRLPRDTLVDLCLKWTQTSNAKPYLTSNRNLLESDEEDYLHEPVENVAALRELYHSLKQQENIEDRLSKRDIIDRIVDGDWRRGLSLHQLADIDFAALEHNDTALRWSALKLVPYQSEEVGVSPHTAKRRKTSQTTTKQPNYPSILPSNFVANLKSHIAPLVKAHYTLHRLSTPSKLVVLRLCIIPNTPFAPVSGNVPRNVRQAIDASRIMYIALPDSCAYIYVSLSGSTGVPPSSASKDNKTVSAAKIDIAATKRVIMEAIPKALSKPQERWSIQNTKLTCRSLKAIELLRGNSRPGTSGGCYSRFSEEYEWTPVSQSAMRNKDLCSAKTGVSQPPQRSDNTPLSIIQPPHNLPLSDHDTDRKSQINTRFGPMSYPTHAKIDRFHVSLTNILATPPTQPSTTISTSKTAHQASNRKRKRRSLEDIEAGRDEPLEVPMQRASAPITVTFSGMDVFRGLKELALLEGGKYVDLNRLPSWATGEKGVSGIVV